MIERVDGPTPRGGTYMIIAHKNDAGDDVPKAKATQVFISEYDDDDEWLGETVVVTERSVVPAQTPPEPA